MSRRDQVIHLIVGDWAFNGGYEKGNKKLTIERNPLLESITFNSNMTFKYVCQDSEYGKLQVTGNWDIGPKASTIKFMNRSTNPSTPITAIDFERRLRLVELNKFSIEDEFELVPHPDPAKQVGKVGRVKVIYNYVRTK